MTSASGKQKEPKGDERRRSKRMAVSEAFSFFIVIPNKLGMSRIYMKDVSTGGLSFWTEMPGQFAAGAEILIRLYTGPTLYLPLSVRVVRAGAAEVAVEFTKKEAKSVAALGKFLEFLDLATEAAVVEQSA